MYIPTWFLIVGIIIGIYFFVKKSKEKQLSVPTISKQNSEFDSLDKDQKDTLIRIGKYRTQTGKHTATYEEMLKMSKDDFSAWMIFRTLKPNREEFLDEMVDHEERTKSFQKTAKGDEQPESQLVLDLFTKDKKASIKKVFDDMANVLKDGETDLVRDGIYAKAVSDFFGLGEKMEKEKASS